MNKKFWKNKRVLITGHTGFKGSWLTLILNDLGVKIYGYSLNPNSNPNFFDGLNLGLFLKKDFRKNILNKKDLDKVIKLTKPHIIFHLAAQSSVLVSYKFPIETLNTNVLGTANVLDAVKKNKFTRSMIIVTTDKVYENPEKNLSFSEKDKLGGHDVYSGSKAAAEIVTQSYLKSFFLKNKICNIATVRSGNCIGGGDWTKDRIVKDCAESFLRNKKLIIRSPKATRPWQHVMEPLFGYLNLAEKLYHNKKYEGAWNFGPSKKSNFRVIDVAKFGKKFLNSKSKILIKKKVYYESNYLSLNSSKSLKNLKWKTMMNAEEALKLTFAWYKNYEDKTLRKKIIPFTLAQIEKYKEKL